jgi:hypothetical protein
MVLFQSVIIVFQSVMVKQMLCLETGSEGEAVEGWSTIVVTGYDLVKTSIMIPEQCTTYRAVHYLQSSDTEIALNKY